MNILVISQYYYPEQFRIVDICEELVQRGNRVTVLTGLPCYNFPNGEIPCEYKYGHDKETINGVNIIRVHQRARKRGLLNRFLNYYSFATKSTKAVKKLSKGYDVVFVYGPSPVMQGKAAIRYKKLYGTPIVFYCMDLWPASLSVGGIKINGLIYNHYKEVSKKIYGASDIIAVTSESFVEYIRTELKLDNRIEYVPQYSEDLFDERDCRKAPNDNIDLMFAGNIGIAQSLSTVIKTVAKLKNIDNLHWHIVGGGSELENIKNLVRELDVEDKVTFYGQQPLHKMPSYYSKADAMLVTLYDNKTIARTLPGKVQTYMAAGKPIIGAIGGETAEVIKKANCGFCGSAENVEELTENVLKFLYYKNKETLGYNAKIYYEKQFSKEKFFTNIERVILSLND